MLLNQLIILHISIRLDQILSKCENYETFELYMSDYVENG